MPCFSYISFIYEDIQFLTNLSELIDSKDVIEHVSICLSVLCIEKFRSCFLHLLTFVGDVLKFKIFTIKNLLNIVLILSYIKLFITNIASFLDLSLISFVVFCKSSTAAVTSSMNSLVHVKIKQL